jgi:hypothetical protein
MALPMFSKDASPLTTLITRALVHWHDAVLLPVNISTVEQSNVDEAILA